MIKRLCFLICLVAVSVSAEQRPNIIWLMAEDMALDLSCYGMPGVDTPNLDRLAGGGLKFTRAYCTNSICGPNRSAMMTGTHQLLIGAGNHRSNRNTPLREPYKPFTHYLREAGYTCILGNANVFTSGRKTDCNFQHEPIGKWEENYGLFDKYDEFLPQDAPFFAQIQLRVTHRGDWWTDIRAKSPSPTDPAEVVLPPFLADDPIVRLDWAKYIDQIEYMDREVGALIEDLKRKGLYENTVIIFIGDNGRANLRGKGYLFDSGLHVPFILSWPNGIQEAKVRDDLVSTTDITATILDLAGLPVPEFMTGRSVLAEDFHRDYVFSARDRWDDIIDRSRSLTNGQGLRYIRNEMAGVPYDAHHSYLEFYRPALHAMRKLDMEGKLTTEQALFFQLTKPAEQFFDLNMDPDELVNLIDDPRYASDVANFRTELDRMEQTYAYPDAHDDMEPLIVPKVLDFVGYFFPDEYLRLLAGEEIGYQKYQRLYQEHLKRLGRDE